MKQIKVKFNNVWDDYGDCDPYEIIIFNVPEDLNIDIRKETKILNDCYDMLNDYECADEKELAEALIMYPDVTEKDLEDAKKVLGEDGGMGPIASRIADFIQERYPNVSWEFPDNKCDLEIDIK